MQPASMRGVQFGTRLASHLGYGRVMTVTPPYIPLHTYLKAKYLASVELTFAEIETLLGFSLPGAARLYKEWWTHGDAADGAPQLCAWTHAGRRAWPNLFACSVSFERVAPINLRN